MSLPPPGGPFPPPPPPGPGFPGAGQPQSRPGPQQPWPPGPFPPPSPSAPTSRGRARKWVLGGIALLAVIAVTATITVVVSRGSGDGGDGGTTPPADTYGLASADDKGPVAIITEEPTCGAWNPIRETMAQSQRQGWADRDINVPATEWSPELRVYRNRTGHRTFASDIDPRRSASVATCTGLNLPSRREVAPDHFGDSCGSRPLPAFAGPHHHTGALISRGLGVGGPR